MKLFLYILAGAVGAVVAVSLVYAVVYALMMWVIEPIYATSGLYWTFIAMIAFMGAVIGVVIYFTKRPTRPTVHGGED